LASKNKTTITTRTQDTITQQELTELLICQNGLAQLTTSCESREGEIASQWGLLELGVCQKRLAQLTASCRSRESEIARKLLGNAVIERGRFFLAGTSVGVQA